MLKTDLQGRVITAPHEVRGGVVTANATLTTGTAASFIVGDADYYLDILEVTFATSSTATLGGTEVQVDLINDGTIVRSVGVPYGTTQLFFDIPLKQITKGTPWNVDMNDITGTTVWVGATIIKNPQQT